MGLVWPEVVDLDLVIQDGLDGHSVIGHELVGEDHLGHVVVEAAHLKKNGGGEVRERSGGAGTEEKGILGSRAKDDLLPSDKKLQLVLVGSFVRPFRQKWPHLVRRLLILCTYYYTSVRPPRSPFARLSLLHPPIHWCQPKCCWQPSLLTVRYLSQSPRRPKVTTLSLSVVGVYRDIHQAGRRKRGGGKARLSGHGNPDSEPQKSRN